MGKRNLGQDNSWGGGLRASSARSRAVVGAGSRLPGTRATGKAVDARNGEWMGLLSDNEPLNGCLWSVMSLSHLNGLNRGSV